MVPFLPPGRRQSCLFEGPRLILEGIRIYLYLEKESKTKELGWDELRCKLNSPLSAGDQRTMGTKQVGLLEEAVGGRTQSAVHVRELIAVD